MKTLYLVDASAMFFRAYYAIAPLSTSEGFPTGALRGFLNMSLKLLGDEKPDYMAYCFDRPEPSFRAQLDANYKANRGEMPDDLSCQVPYMRPFTESLGVTCLDKKNFEADDIIGTLAHQAATQGLKVVIVSGDKDFAQLISDQVIMYDTMKNVKYTPDKVLEKWGIQPKQMIDYLAIVGDSSDNIAGVRGIGPKGACRLLSEHKSLKNILHLVSENQAAEDSVGGRKKSDSKSRADKSASCQPPFSAGILAKLQAGRKDALLAQQLVTIKTDVPLDVGVEDLKLKPVDQSELTKLLVRFEFQNIGKRLEKIQNWSPQSGAESSPQSGAESSLQAGANSTDAHAKGVQVKDVRGAMGLANNCDPKIQPSDGTLPVISVGETLADPMCSEKVRWSVMDFEKNLHPGDTLWVVPYEKPAFQGGRGESSLYFAHKGRAIELAAAPLEHLARVLENKKLNFKGYDLKTSWHLLKMQTPAVPVCDLMLAAYTLQAKEIKGLDMLQAVYGGQVLGARAGAGAGAVELVNSCIELEPLLKEKFSSDKHFKVYHQIELPLLPVLYAMERRGVLIDCERLHRQEQHLTEELHNIEQQVYQQVGREFNLASPKQLGQVLFEDLQLKPVRKTKTGYSTDAQLLSKLSHPVVECVVQHRELSKLLSTYVTALPRLVDAETQRVHTHFMQATTATGRLSSRNPNLQNIPIRTPKGRQVREAFVAGKGQLLLSADYSQIELRVLAEMTNDKALVRAFERDEDVHASTAALVFDTDLKSVTAEQRRIAKAVNFGLAYGQGAGSLAEQLKIKRKEAQNIVDTYFSRFKGVKDYMQATVEQAERRGFVESCFGRRRGVPELKSSNPMLQSFGKRIAINAPIQSTASDLVKMAMLKVHTLAPLLLQVHDELLFECKKSSLPSRAKQIVQAMESVGDFKVPLRVTTGWGPNWSVSH